MIPAGKLRRMSRLIRPETGRILLAPFDDSLLAGPEKGLRDLEDTVRTVVSGGVDSLLGFSSIFQFNEWLPPRVGLVLNLTASTTRNDHTRKTLISSVERAVSMGADCVAVHVNISSRYETEMLKAMGTVAEQCERLGMPLMGIMYPRKEADNQDDNYSNLREENVDAYAELVRHAVRVGVEFGADIIKTQYTGDRESFSTVVQSAARVPIVIAGGPIEPYDLALRKAKSAVLAGAAGISFGRNIYQRKNMEEMAAFVEDLVKVVHTDKEA